MQKKSRYMFMHYIYFFHTHRYIPDSFWNVSLGVGKAVLFIRRITSQSDQTGNNCLRIQKCYVLHHFSCLFKTWLFTKGKSVLSYCPPIQKYYDLQHFSHVLFKRLSFTKRHYLFLLYVGSILSCQWQLVVHTRLKNLLYRRLLFWAGSGKYNFQNPSHVFWTSSVLPRARVVHTLFKNLANRNLFFLEGSRMYRFPKPNHEFWTSYSLPRPQFPPPLAPIGTTPFDRKSIFHYVFSYKTKQDRAQRVAASSTHPLRTTSWIIILESASE